MGAVYTHFCSGIADYAKLQAEERNPHWLFFQSLKKSSGLSRGEKNAERKEVFLQSLQREPSSEATSLITKYCRDFTQGSAERICFAFPVD